MADTSQSLGGSFSSQLNELETCARTLKHDVAGNFIRRFLEARVVGYADLMLDLEEREVSPEVWSANVKDYDRVGLLITMRAAVKGIVKQSRTVEHAAMQKRVYEGRSNTLNSLQRQGQRDWGGLHPGLQLIIYDKLVECGMEKFPGNVIPVYTEQDIRRLCWSLTAPAHGDHTGVRAKLEESLLKEAPFDVKLNLRQVGCPLPGLAGANLHPLMFSVGQAGPLDIAYPWTLYAFCDSLRPIVSGYFPNLQSLNVTIDDSQTNAYALLDRTRSIFVGHHTFLEELIELLGDLGELKITEKYYRFIKPHKTLIGKVSRHSPIGVRRAVFCQEDSVRKRVDDDCLSDDVLERRTVLHVQRVLVELNGMMDSEADEDDKYDGDEEDD